MAKPPCACTAGSSVSTASTTTAPLRKHLIPAFLPSLKGDGEFPGRPAPGGGPPRRAEVCPTPLPEAADYAAKGPGVKLRSAGPGRVPTGIAVRVGRRHGFSGRPRARAAGGAPPARHNQGGARPPPPRAHPLGPPAAPVT